MVLRAREPGRATGRDGDSPLHEHRANAHNFGGPFGRTDTLGAGETDTLTFTADQTGPVEFWCSVPGHREAGMEGQMHVHE